MPETNTPIVAAAWQEDVNTVAGQLATDMHAGLGQDEASARLERCGTNTLEPERAIPAWRRLLAQLRDPLVYLLLIAIAVSSAVWMLEGAHGVPYESIVILVIVVLNAVIGYAQEARAERAVAALQKMAAASASVVRDGREQRIPASEIVPGDILLLAEGDAVAADARLAHAASLTVAEASLTGESEPVLKDTGVLDEPVGVGDRTNMVFSGTAVTRGRGRAVVTATGMRTEMGTIARLLEATDEQDTPLQREIAAVGRSLGLAVIVIAIVVVGSILLTTDLDRGTDLVDVLLIGVSLAVAAVPEGLPAVLSVVLALGVQRMARRNAIVKQLSSVETLGSASVVGSDKTGTLTRNEMMIQRVVTPSGDVSVTGSGYRPEGELLANGRPVEDPVVLDEITAVLSGGCLASNATLHQAASGEWAIQGDPTDGAFLVAEAKLEGQPEARIARYERVGEIPFTSERKLMSTLHIDSERAGEIAMVTKGAPDILLARCASELVAGEIRRLTDERRRDVLAAVDGLADLALRTLAVAYRPIAATDTQEAEEALEHHLTYLGLVGIIDPPRAEVRAAIEEAQTAGIRVIMITGDHPRTAARIASDLGIVQPGAPAMTGAELETIDADGLRAAARHTSVYARVAPEHKLRIIDALRANGNVVSMTGDGVNDAPALKAADIGVAMGITGTDVTKEAADMILADDNFATIIAAVREGRGIFANIRKFIRFLLSSNVGEVLTMLLGVILAPVIGLADAGAAMAVPLLATHILWINLLTDTGPALAMGVDPPPGNVMQRQPRRLSERVINRAMWTGIFWVGLVMATVTLLALDLRLPGGIVGDTGDLVTARTMAFTTLVLAQLFNTFNARSERVSAFHNMFANRWLWGAIALSVSLQIAVVHLSVLNDAFGTTPLTPGDWATCAGLASVVLWAEEVRKLVLRRRA